MVPAWGWDRCIAARTSLHPRSDSGPGHSVISRTWTRLWRGGIIATCLLFRGMAMIDDPVLTEDWHPVALAAQLAGGGPIAARGLGEALVVWRSGGEVFAWRDLRVHRRTRRSLG